MFVYVGRTYTSTAVGRAVREVRCEKCGQTYFYEMIRIATGSGSSSYMLNNRGAAGRAQREAHGNLDRALAHGSDPVPCPDCGWFQEEAIRDARRTKLAWMRVLAFGGAVIVLACAVAVYFLQRSHRGGRTDPFGVWALAVVSASAVLGAVLLLWLRRAIVNRFDPNNTFPQRPQPIPGMPPALRAVSEGPERPPVLIVAHPAEPVPHNGWLTVQMPRVVWPPHCCLCMGHAETRYKPLIRVSQNDSILPVPLCRRCARGLRYRALLWALLAWPISLAAVGAVALAIPVRDAEAKWIASVVIGIGLAVVMTFVLPSQVVRPSRTRVVDGLRGIYLLKFRNAQYGDATAKLYDTPPTNAPEPTTGGFPVVPLNQA